MGNRHPRSARNIVIAAISISAHLALSIFALFSMRHAAVKTVQTEAKSYTVEFHIAGGTQAPPTDKPVGREKPSLHPQKSTLSLAAYRKPAPPTGAPKSVAHATVAGEGRDADDAVPTFPIFSPRPAVTDRSLLPASDKQVVVDVKVSAVGEVLEATIVKGIGNGLDQIVLDTVKTWRFQPATIKGSPVATQAELIFPFNQSYPAPIS